MTRRRDEQRGRSIPGESRNPLPGRFSLVGDVAVIPIPPELDGQKLEIGEAIISSHKNVKSVLNKISKLEGERRVASFEVLAGCGTVTCHREFGFAYELDVSRVFFNPRLAYERMRVASKVRDGERAIVPFVGVNLTDLVIWSSLPAGGAWPSSSSPPPQPPTRIEGAPPAGDRLSPEDQPADPEGRLAGDDEQGREDNLASGGKGGHRDEKERAVEEAGEDDEEEAEPPSQVC